MTINVKVCGIKSINHARACVKGKAKMVGLMFYKKSPRFISLNLASKISSFVGNKIKKVGVVANIDILELEKIIKNVKLDYVQLHGNETPQFLQKIKKTLKIKIIKALKISNEKDIKKIQSFKKYADYLLLDTKIIKKNNLNLKKKSQRLNWDLLKKIKKKKFFILSGALNNENLEEATKKSNIKFVDVSSSLENAPGKKSIKKINSFLKIATKL